MKTDRQLQMDVMTELDWDPAVDASHIGVDVAKGVATLSGHVATYVQKRAAERAVQRVAGIKAVALDLVDVTLPGPNRRDDRDIIKAATTAIDWNAAIPAGSIKLLVKNGQVTLTGETEWAYIRNAAEVSVRDLYGVTDVVNMINICPRVEPHGVKTKVEAALQRRAHFNASAVKVGAEKGTVNLTGEVDSLAEFNAAELAAWNAPGVQKVVNNLTVGH